MRAWSLDDIEAVYQACQAADIQRYTTVPVPYLREHAEHFVREVAPQGWAQKTAAGFAVTGRADGRLLGACGLAAIDADERSSGAGYWVDPWGRGRGVAARALTLLTSWAFDAVGLQRIQMEIEPENEPSVRCAIRAGYRAMHAAPLREMHREAVREFALYERLRDQG